MAHQVGSNRQHHMRHRSQQADHHRSCDHPRQAGSKRYQQQPYHAAIIDARTVGRDGVTAYNDLLRTADNAGLKVDVILLLSAEQSKWKHQAREHEHGAVLFDPGISMKSLLRTLDELTPPEKPRAAGA